MPVSKSAIKALKRDRKHAGVSQLIRSKMRAEIKRALEESKAELVSKAYSSIDRAAKKKLIHKNKAARIKSRLMRALKK